MGKLKIPVRARAAAQHWRIWGFGKSGAFGFAVRVAVWRTSKSGPKAGSLRRGLETVGDLDFIVAAHEVGPVVAWFVAQPGVQEVVAAERDYEQSLIRPRAPGGEQKIELF